MRGLSTEPKYIVPCLSVYSGIKVEQKKSIEGIGPARFYSPKPGLEEKGEPYIAIFNKNSQTVYQIVEEKDYEATQRIMGLLSERFVIPEGEEPLFYIIFVLLHEAGHWYDYHNKRSWFNQNATGEVSKTAEEYRKKPIEKSADRFALEHFESAWNELNDRLFRGNMEPLKKQSEI